MKIFRRRTFDLSELKLGPGIYADYEFDRCSFSYPPFAFPHHPKGRAVVRNIKLVNCEAQAPRVNAMVAEGCTIENLKTLGATWNFGAVFKRTIPRGRFDRLMFTDWCLGADEADKGKFRRAEEACYEHVDWAPAAWRSPHRIIGRPKCAAGLGLFWTGGLS